MSSQPNLEVARAAIREAHMLSIGSHQPHEVNAQQELLGTALRALEGELTSEDFERVDLPLKRGYGRPGHDLARREDFSSEFRDE